jgi:low temperature requirement protein LtrA
VADAEREPDNGAEHAVTPLELFFDLVFVFAITQSTKLLTNGQTRAGVLRGL